MNDNDNDDMTKMIHDPRPDLMTASDRRYVIALAKQAAEWSDGIAMITRMIANAVFVFASLGMPRDQAVGRALAMAELAENQYEAERDKIFENSEGPAG
jgi:hypothetical protein